VHVLVTGGAGFIGSHLVDALLARGDTVAALDDLSSGRKGNLPPRPGLRFVRGTVLEEGIVNEAARGAAVIFHLAARVGVRRVVRNPLDAIEVNVRGTEVVLREAARTGAKVVLASSSEVYGKSAGLPFREDGDRLLGPTSVARWSYATAKALDEHLALAHAQRGLGTVVLRYFNCYGPRVDLQGYGSVVGVFLSCAREGRPLVVHGDGRQTRCFTYVADTVHATLLAAERAGALGQVINAGSDREISILELAHKVLEATGSRSPLAFVPYEQVYGPSFEDAPRRVPDLTRARELLGFEAKVDLDEGLKKTYAWMLSET